jgi:hypothetical protein
MDELVFNFKTVIVVILRLHKINDFFLTIYFIYLSNKIFESIFIIKVDS